jgi:AAA+ ATPase superfamily predicted ATPase
MFVAREEHLVKMDEIVEKEDSSFVAIYGRRRVGKTEFVRHFCKINNHFFIEFTGKRKTNKKLQIASFVDIIERTFSIKQKEKLKEWGEAFSLLRDGIESMKYKRKKIIFIDELPWLDSWKSGFLEELAYFWNNFLSTREDVVLVVCGSAASYMLKKVIHNKGPLHGRVTDIIEMKQFDLTATKALLVKQGCNYSDKSIVELYMVFGGVAKYLRAISCKKTPQENIQNICFSKTGILHYEYDDLFSSLFNNAKSHYLLMNQLSTHWKGYTQIELAKLLKISSSSITIPLNELYASSFVSKSTKFGQTKRETIFRTTDCFSYFHHKWIKPDKPIDWVVESRGQSFRTWAGFAFENICHVHIDKIKDALRIGAVPTQTHYWNYIPKTQDEMGAQIDMLIEHTNGSKNIDIIECKYYEGMFAIDKAYKEKLVNKMMVFNEQTKFKYNIRLIFVTVNGVKKNSYYNEIVSESILLEDLL